MLTFDVITLLMIPPYPYLCIPYPQLIIAALPSCVDAKSILTARPWTLGIEVYDGAFKRPGLETR